MNDQFTNVRIESKNISKMKRAIKHSLRMIKISSNQKYIRRIIDKKATYVFNPNHNKQNMFWINGIDNDTNSFSKEERREIGKDLIDKLQSRQDEHAKRLMANKGKYLDKKRVNSFADGVLTFSHSIKDLVDEDKEKIFKLGVKTILNMAKELGVEVHYITFDLDEIGLPHFQYYFDNFDSLGNALNIDQSKKGSMLQDLGEIEFKELGFTRGIKKEISGNRNMPNGVFQAVKDEMKQKQIEINDLENKKFDLQNDVSKELLDLTDDFNKLVAFYGQYGYYNDLEKLQKNFLKYKKLKNVGKASNLIEKHLGKARKYQKQIEKAEKEKQKEEALEQQSNQVKKKAKKKTTNNNNLSPTME